ncbi:MAG: site-2 protease family protein [Desulfobacterota bacterium]|nr:site-2 protease family protein [Thermodesulfobacteriota bacterium]MDW8002075.1 site-2 protease family protein [Deltaproteobacteria bacterium]
MLIELLFENPLAFFCLSIPLIYAIVFHEVAHAYSAYVLGDRSQRWYGRLTLNPLKHLDPIGTLTLFLFGFGWAKPVPVNFYSLRDTKWATIFVSASGILTNILLAFFSLFLIKVLAFSFGSVPYLVLSYFARVNIILASFNLIPIPPLDGSKILMGFVSGDLKYTLIKLEPYGFYIIIALLLLGVLDPIVESIRSLIVALLELIVS